MSRGPYRDQQPLHTPSEEEIEAHCRAIRRGWSQREEQNRRAWSLPRPVVVLQVRDFAMQVALKTKE